MRRVFLLVMIFVLCCAPIAAVFADTVDVTLLSDEELTALFEQVKNEMAIRGLDKAESYSLPEGKYIVGQDIRPGRYVLTCVATAGEQLGDAYSSLGGLFGALGGDEKSASYGDAFGSLGGMMGDLVSTQVKVIGDYGTVLRSFELKKDQSIQISLDERTALQIEDGTCTLTPVD